LNGEFPKDFSIQLSAPDAAGMRIVIANCWRSEVLAAFIFSYRLNKSIPSMPSISPASPASPAPSSAHQHHPCPTQLSSARLLLPHGVHCLLPQSCGASGINSGGKCIIKVQKSEAECISLEIGSALFKGLPYISGFGL